MLEIYTQPRSTQSHSTCLLFGHRASRVQSLTTVCTILVLLIFAQIALVSTSLAQNCQYSPYWGENGELWDPNGRLKDFSHVGYRGGNVPIPYGTKPITYGPGRHEITKRLFLKSGQVLRGAGRDKTVLYFPKPLREIGNNECPSGGNNCYGWSYAVVQAINASNVGVEDLTIEFPVHGFGHHGNYPGWNALEFRGTSNAWVKNVRIVNSDAGVMLWDSDHITVDGAEIIANPQGSHYHVIVTGFSAQNHLITNFRVGNSSSHGVAGNWDGDWVVFSNGAPLPGTSGIRLQPHHNGPGTTTFLWSNIQGAGGVKLTKDSFAWNVGNQKLCPLDIHQAQLANRLGIAPSSIAAAGPDQTVLVGQVVTLDGEGSNAPDGDAITFQGDFGDGSTSTQAVITHTDADVGIYTVELTVSNNSQHGQFGYRFDVPSGEYDVTLHFPEVHWKGPDKRLFDVYIEGTLVLDNYDIDATVGGDVPVVLTLPGIVVDDGQLTIDFVAIEDNAVISAIER